MVKKFELTLNPMKTKFLIFLLFASTALKAQFVTEEKTLETATGKLVGTLYLPQNAKNNFKLLIIQPGSGATDRNGNTLPMIKPNNYKLIAEAMANKNIATLLVDKRGIAGSMGALKAEKDLRFDDYANDLADWVRFIKKDKRIKKVYLVGHSEGSLVAMLSAQKEKVNGYISIAGAGEAIDKIIVWQYKQQLPKVALVVDSLFGRMKNNLPIDTVPKMLTSIFRPSVQPYIASWIKYDPAAEIAKLKIPVLIVQGSTDIQVTIEQSEYLKKANPKAKYALIKDMNHILKIAPMDRQKNIATYSAENLPLHEELINQLYNFIKK
jgi:uncharacterized protein